MENAHNNTPETQGDVFKSLVMRIQQSNLLSYRTEKRNKCSHSLDVLNDESIIKIGAIFWKSTILFIDFFVSAQILGLLFPTQVKKWQWLSLFSNANKQVIP